MDKMLKKELLFEYLHNNISLKEIDIKDKSVLDGLEQYEIYEVLGVYFSDVSKEFKKYFKEEVLSER